MEATGTYVLHGPTGSTHVWQMIDRHVGKMHKDLLAEEQLEYLADDDHNAGFSSLSASDRRVLLTHWVGVAREFTLPASASSMENCCAASGLLLTLTGKGRMPSVESSPVFALQANQQWEGLTDAIEGSWKDDVQNVESDGSSDSSSSSTSSSSSSDSNPDSLPDVPDHAAVEEVDQANQQLAEPAVPEPVPENLVSVHAFVSKGTQQRPCWCTDACRLCSLWDCCPAPFPVQRAEGCFQPLERSCKGCRHRCVGRDGNVKKAQ